MEHIQIFCTSKVSTGTVQNRHIILQARVLNIASKVRVSFHAKICTDLFHVQLQLNSVPVAAVQTKYFETILSMIISILKRLKKCRNSYSIAFS